LKIILLRLIGIVEYQKLAYNKDIESGSVRITRAAGAEVC
jgi:hypothetical protein